MKNYKFYLGLIIIPVSIILGLYIAIWWGIVEPIMTIADAIDNNTVTAKLVGIEVIKFLLKEFVASLVVFFGWSLGLILIKNNN